MCCDTRHFRIQEYVDVMQYWMILIGLGIALLSLMLQFGGHVILDGSFPGFRAFEFTFSTPFYTRWIALCCYDTKTKKVMEELVAKWSGSEKYVYKHITHNAIVAKCHGGSPRRMVKPLPIINWSIRMKIKYNCLFIIFKGIGNFCGQYGWNIQFHTLECVNGYLSLFGQVIGVHVFGIYIATSLEAIQIG